LPIADRGITESEEGINVAGLAHEDLTPVAENTPVESATERTVEVLETTMMIHDLLIERPSIVAYLQTISPAKQQIALVHALEVGVTEMIARRERFKH
jgi:hypothetical protein